MPYAISSTYTAPNGDSRSPAIAPMPDVPGALPPSEPTDTASRSPATVVSLSPAAWSALQPERPSLAALPESPQHNARPVPDLGKIMEASRIEMELGRLDDLEKARAANTETLGRFQASYKKLRDTPPKPATVLDEAGKARALKLLKEEGLTLTIPKDGNYGFGKDGIIYMFKSDGTVTAEEDGVATSFEVQQRSLAQYTGMISRQQHLLRDTSSERAALLASRTALLGDTAAAN